MTLRLTLVLPLLFASTLFAQPPVLPDGTADAQKTIAKLKLSAGFRADLFAAEPQLGNPVAFCIDEMGRVFVAESYRFNRGTEEYRHRPFFLEGDLQNRTVDGRLAMYQKFAAKFPGGMDFFRKYADRVRLLEDKKGVGRADHAITFADGFNDPLDGLAAGVLARKGDVYFTCIPRLWLLRDTKGIGQADVKKALHHGFGTQTAFLGHDLHGLVFGPDGKLYFSVGDRGYNVKTHEGKTLEGPRQGAVFRCDPGGANLEVVHVGLRNPQELAFDQFGDLFAADNNCDKGDHSRLVYVVEGGHSGWNMAYQTMEAPYLTGPWHAERLWHLQHPGQPAWIVPAVGKLGAGPSGFTFTSGLGMPSRYRDAFFMCNFTGGKGGVDAFRVEHKGAGFDLIDYHTFLTPLLATDVDFGFDGKMYVSDWVEFTWDGGGVGKGRIYTIYDPKTIQSPAILALADIMRSDWKKRDDLASLLAHDDQRIRLRAQHELAERGAVEAFKSVAHKSTNQLARLHAIWGLGQIGRQKPPLVVKELQTLLRDTDAEVRAQAAKVLGDLPVPDTVPALLPLLADAGPRVRFFAAQSLGKLRAPDAIEPLIALLRANKDADVYLRHAAIVALERIGNLDAVVAHAGDAEPAVRLAVLLVLRRRDDVRIARFLKDADPLIVTEAARAINDLPLNAALPALADVASTVLITKTPLPDPLVRRVINAHYRLDGVANVAALAKLATASHLSPAMRDEALQCLATWDLPSPRDRVIGHWRPLAERSSALLAKVVERELATLLAGTQGKQQTEVARLITRLNLKVDEARFADWVADSGMAVDSRIAALKLLSARNFPALEKSVQIALESAEPHLRAAAREVVLQREPGRGLQLLKDTLQKGAVLERQLAYRALGQRKEPLATQALNADVELLLAGKLAADVQLDVLLAARQSDDSELKKLVARYDQSLNRDDPLGSFQVTLRGGDAQRGRNLFLGHAVGQCIRCHKVAGTGGDAGPALDKLEKPATREHLLESLLLPDQKITPGYGSVTLILDSGKTVTGIVRTENARELTLLTPDDRTLTIPVSSIEVRTPARSVMPSMRNVLTLDEMRDVIEYLATLRGNR